MTRHKRFDKFVNFHIEGELLERLDKVADRKGWPRNMLIREYIKQGLETDEEKPQTP